MANPRRPLSSLDEKRVLVASRRKCCLCVYLYGRNEPRKGQIAHLNRDRMDGRPENLVWLCFDHHDEYDSRTSQSKGLTLQEVRHYRDALYAEIGGVAFAPERIAKRNSTERPWHYPLWQVANQPEIFAYTVPGGMDGVCLIERINIPDGRIVIVCVQVAGNPGRSITNSAEYISMQVCSRFELSADRVVWLQHYENSDPDDWMLVSFRKRPPTHSRFELPEWTEMTEDMWQDLKLRPKRRLVRRGGYFDSPVQKRFHWPTEPLLE
jgi:hypothetical protein